MRMTTTMTIARPVLKSEAGKYILLKSLTRLTKKIYKTRLQYTEYFQSTSMFFDSVDDTCRT